MSDYSLVVAKLAEAIQAGEITDTQIILTGKESMTFFAMTVARKNRLFISCEDASDMASELENSVLAMFSDGFCDQIHKHHPAWDDAEDFAKAKPEQCPFTTMKPEQFITAPEKSMYENGILWAKRNARRMKKEGQF